MQSINENYTLREADESSLAPEIYLHKNLSEWLVYKPPYTIIVIQARNQFESLVLGQRKKPRMGEEVGSLHTLRSAFEGDRVSCRAAFQRTSLGGLAVITSIPSAGELFYPRSDV